MRKILAGLVLTVALAAAAAYASGIAGNGLDAGGAERLENAVRQAAVACYSTEGRYPPDVAYLEAHYGLRPDSRYAVDYRIFGSNVPPEITVLRKDGAGR